MIFIRSGTEHYQLL